MAERRGKDEPLPRRTLSGPPTQSTVGAPRERRPLTGRLSAAVSSAGSAVSSAASRRTGSTTVSAETAVPTGPTTSPTTGPATGRSGGPSTGRSGRAPAEASADAPSSARRGSRRARLRLVHLDPWSVMKTSILLSVAFGIVTVVAVAVVWSVLGAAGVWDSINSAVGDVVGGDTASSFDVRDYVGTSRVLGLTMVIAAFDVIVITAVSTLCAFLYNLAAALLGGVEVTLAEDDR